ncbi:MAG: DUF2283 domain-containing protein [Candidatus Pacearchaeota archaeon]|jgi:uncharacterized protein YuzE
MIIEVDKNADAAYIYFREIKAGEVVQTISLNEEINIDLDKDGITIGIEVLNASKNLPSSSFKDAKLINLN